MTTSMTSPAARTIRPWPAPCTNAPHGTWCLRDNHHDGPCHTRPLPANRHTLASLTWLTRDARSRQQQQDNPDNTPHKQGARSAPTRPAPRVPGLRPSDWKRWLRGR